MKNKLWIGLLLTCLTYSVLFGGIFDNGSGTEADPFQIWTADDLNELGLYPGGWNDFYILMADVNMADIEMAHYNIIAPDTDPDTSGFQGDAFIGGFDGNGFVISNLVIYDANEYVGMFGSLGGNSLIKDIRLEDVDIAGGNDTGALAGSMGPTVNVSGCSATGFVTGSLSTGGLIGENLGGLIEACCADVNVVADDDYAGGLAGYNEGTIQKCCAVGDVNGLEEQVGGLVGANYYNIHNCYALGKVEGVDYVGGLVGLVGTYQVVTNSFSAGEVVSDGTYVGGLVGYGVNAFVMRSFWDMETSGMNHSSGGTGLTTQEMYDITNYTNNNWALIGSGSGDGTWIKTRNNYPRFTRNADTFILDVIYDLNADWLKTENMISDYNEDGQVNFMDYSVIIDQ